MSIRAGHEKGPSALRPCRRRLALRVVLLAAIGLAVPLGDNAFALSTPPGASVARRTKGLGKRVAPTKVPSVAPSRRSPAAALPLSGGRKKVRSGGAPAVVLYHINHRETLRLRMTDERGRPVRGMQRQVDNFLRCHYTKRRHAMNPRLTRLLYEIGQHYPGRRIEVVSGYRHPRFAKNPRSPHMKGLAFDMRVAGIKNTELRDFFRQRFKSVGVGYYPNSSFVHLDVRRGASAFWIDYSGPGESALYAKNALDDLRSGRAERWRRTTIDSSWADQEADQDEELGRAADTSPGEDGSDSAPMEGVEVNDEAGGDMP